MSGLDQVSSISGLLTLPIAAWELAVGLWMTFRGFDPSSPVLAGRPAEAAQG